MNRILLLLVAFIGLLALQTPSDAYADSCHGRFTDPISAPCWDCMFPLSIGDAPIFPSSYPDPANPASPICLCGTPIPRIGLETGYWEPARLIDVTQHPYCFVNLGGIQLELPWSQKKTQISDAERGDRTAYHVHYYIYPLLSWLGILTDFICMESESYDIAYITEFDPTFNDDEVAALINPEVFIFSNPVAIEACAGDCVASTTGLPVQQMFWCAGCQGTLYPMSGQVPGNYGPLPGAEQVIDRFMAKMHRQFLALGMRGDASVCGPIIEPTMDKLQYRVQEIYPMASHDGSACAPIGRSTVLWESGKVIPTVGEDLGFLLWRKRNCCAL